MLPPGYEEGTSNFVLAAGSADASGHEAAPAAAIDTLSRTDTLSGCCGAHAVRG